MNEETVCCEKKEIFNNGLNCISSLTQKDCSKLSIDKNQNFKFICKMVGDNDPNKVNVNEGRQLYRNKEGFLIDENDETLGGFIFTYDNDKIINQEFIDKTILASKDNKLFVLRNGTPNYLYKYGFNPNELKKKTDSEELKRYKKDLLFEVKKNKINLANKNKIMLQDNSVEQKINDMRADDDSLIVKGITYGNTKCSFQPPLSSTISNFGSNIANNTFRFLNNTQGGKKSRNMKEKTKKKNRIKKTKRKQ